MQQALQDRAERAQSGAADLSVDDRRPRHAESPRRHQSQLPARRTGRSSPTALAGAHPIDRQRQCGADACANGRALARRSSSSLNGGPRKRGVAAGGRSAGLRHDEQPLRLGPAADQRHSHAPPIRRESWTCRRGFGRAGNAAERADQASGALSSWSRRRSWRAGSEPRSRRLRMWGRCGISRRSGSFTDRGSRCLRSPSWTPNSGRRGSDR